MFLSMALMTASIVALIASASHGTMAGFYFRLGGVIRSGRISFHFIFQMVW